MADILLHVSETLLMRPLVWGADDAAAALPPQHWARQLVSLLVFTMIGSYLLYFMCGRAARREREGVCV